MEILFHFIKHFYLNWHSRKLFNCILPLVFWLRNLIHFWDSFTSSRMSRALNKIIVHTFSILSHKFRKYLVFCFFILFRKTVITFIRFILFNFQKSCKKFRILFFILEFQWFLIALSVRPGKKEVISTHLLPFNLWQRNNTHSSSSLQASLLILGFKWLCHLSLHYFPILPGICWAIKVHFYGPYYSTN